MSLKRNVYGAYLYSFAAWFGITNLWVIFLGQRGISLVQIGLCESIFHVASFCFEMPSGMLADRFSYKTVLYFSRMMAIISAAMMLVGNTFLWFAASFVISAFSYNLQSGTLEALVYESLAPDAQVATYPRITSMMGIVTEVASTSGVIIAGLLVHGHLALTYVIAIVWAVVALGTIFFMKEPGVHGPQEEKQTMRAIIVAAVAALRQQPRLRNLMLVDASISAVGTAFYYYFQSVMTDRNFSGTLISTLMLVSSLVAIVAMRLIPSLQRRFQQLPLLLGMAGTMTVALMVSGIHQIGVMLVAYLIVEGISAILYPLFNTYYNELIPSAQRATLLSVASMVFSIEMVVLFPVCGWLISLIGFNWTFLMLGGLLTVGLMSWGVYQKRRVNLS